MSTKWLYIGCRLSELPPNFLTDSKKLTKDEIKQILESIPIEDGSAYANSEEDLVRTLISNGIFPVKIKPYSNLDNKILKLKKIRNIAARNEPMRNNAEEVKILNQYEKPKKSMFSVIVVLTIIVTIIAIVIILIR